jgi:4-amino-4-deoxy-L-arabinose transferase-like glycosyltransferase
MAGGFALLVIGVIVPLAIADRYGALGLPRSDDWSYLRALFEWSQHGQLDFNEWVSMTLIGQLVLARPVVWLFGDDVAAMHVASALLGWAGLLAVVSVGRGAGLPRRLAFLGGIVVAASPLWATLAPTFMTDVPAFALQTLALAAAVRALVTSTRATAWLATAIGLATFAVAIRQYAIVTLGATLLTAWLLDRSGRPIVSRRNLVVLTTVSTAGIAVLFAWWFGIPDRLSLAPQVPSGYSVRLAFSSMGGFLRLTALLQLPLILVANPRWLVQRARERAPRATRWVAGATTALLGITYALDVERPFVGNYVDRRGTLSDDIIEGARPYVIPRWAFEGLVVVASLAAVVLVLAALPATAAAWRRVRDRSRQDAAYDPITVLLGSMVAAMFLSYELALLVQFPMFDRYVLPGLAPVGILLLRSSARDAASEPGVESRGRRIGGAALAAVVTLGGLGIVYGQESAAFDTARWTTAERAVAMGFAAEDVYTGYEWRGWTTGKAPGFRPSIAERKRLRKLYMAGVCVEARTRPDGRVGSEDRLVVAVAADAWLRPRAWIVARVSDRACASGASTEAFASEN